MDKFLSSRKHHLQRQSWIEIGSNVLEHFDKVGSIVPNEVSVAINRIELHADFALQAQFLDELMGLFRVRLTLRWPGTGLAGSPAHARASDT